MSPNSITSLPGLIRLGLFTAVEETSFALMGGMVGSTGLPESGWARSLSLSSLMRVRIARTLSSGPSEFDMFVAEDDGKRQKGQVLLFGES